MSRHVLFLHQNFPGQFPHLAAELVRLGDRVTAIGTSTAKPIPGVNLHRYDPRPRGEVPACHPWVTDLQTKCFRAEALGGLVSHLLEEGLEPDLVIGHPGWGELLMIKDILPDVPVWHQVELIYQLRDGDTDFDPEFTKPDWRSRTRLRLKRLHQLQALHDLDWGVAPTEFQASTVPSEYRQRLSVIHEGVDTDAIAPRSGSFIQLQKLGLRFEPGDEVISFVSRSLEPYRGFHSFMRMLPLLQKLRPNAHVIIVGSDGVSYGAPPPGGGSWRQQVLAELAGQLDLSRIHFVGRISHSVLHDLFRVVACHVYLTYPFVLSWSLLEAMSCGTVVIGSSTPPVKEVIEHGRTGLLVDFFDLEAMANCIAGVLAEPAAYRPLGEAARQRVIRRFDLRSVCLPQQLALVDQLINADKH